MKKHLIAAAVAAAVAAPAMAQVTVYGRLDAGYSSFKTNASSGDNSGITYNADSTSRIGLKGSEDLGNGLKASFVLEGSAAGGTTMANTTSAAASLGQSNGFSAFQRAQWLGLSGSFGEIKIGLKNSLTKDTVEGFNAGGASNVEGHLTHLLGTAGTASRDNSIMYTTPSFNGLSATVSVLSIEDDGSTKDSGSEVGVSYKAGPLAASVVARSVANSATSNDTNTKQNSLGVSYDFGFATALAVYSVVEKEATSAIEDEATEFGLRIPFGKANAFMSVATGDSTTGTSAPIDTEAMQFGVRYSLSKRTYAYAITGNSKVGTVEEKNTAIGIVHSF